LLATEKKSQSIDKSMRSSPRDRRLEADYMSITSLLGDSSIITAEAQGRPPTQYRFRFHGWGLQQNAYGEVELTSSHEVTVELGAAYPRMMPTLAWRTPIFHPNISANGIVCLGGYGTHWVPSLTLSELCCMLWDIIRYKNFDPDSPYNREAAAWVRSQQDYRLPLDPRPLRNLVVASAAVATNQAKSPAAGSLEFGKNSAVAAPTGSTAGNCDIIETGVEIITPSRNEPPPDIQFL
jgi:ubiquitin-protein ligase